MGGVFVCRLGERVLPAYDDLGLRLSIHPLYASSASSHLCCVGVVTQCILPADVAAAWPAPFVQG